MRMSRILLALLTTVMLSTSGCGRFKSAEGFYQDAMAQHKQGQERAAVIQLKNALEKDANFGPARYLLAVVYNELGDFGSAEKEARKALQLGFDKGQATIELARALNGQGQGKKVLDEIPATGWQGETLATIIALRGDASFIAGDAAAAKTAYQQAVASAPGHLGALLGLARIAAAQGDFEGALKYVDESLAKSPQDVQALLLKGDLLRASNKRDQAVAVFNEVLKLRPDHAAAHLSLASLNMEANKLQEARAEVEKVRKAQPNNLMGTYMNALLDFREAKYSQARDHLQQVLKSAPDHVPSVVLYGAVSFELGAYEEAEKKLSPVLERMPQNAYVRKLVAATQLKLGKAKLALETIKPLLLATQADPQALSLAGEAYLGVNDPKQATAYFERAAQASPDNAPMRARVGVSRLVSGDVDAGIAELEKASRMDPKQTQADGALVMTYMRLKQYDKALAAIDALDKKQPNSALVYNMRGGAYMGKGEVANARKAFEQALTIDPGSLAAAKNLAQLDMADKKPDMARQRLKSVLAKDPNNTGAMLALADLAAAEQQEKDYLDWVEKAAKAAPKAMEPKVRQVAYFLGKQETQKALALAREAQTANPDNAQAWELLGRTQLAAGEKENAIASFTKVTQLAPTAPRAQLDLGAAMASASRWDDARAALRKALSLNPDYVDARRVLIALELQQNRGSEALKVAEEQTHQQPKLPVGPMLEGDVLMSQKQYAQAAKAYDRAFTLAPAGTTLTRIHQALLLAGDQKGADARLLSWLKTQPNDVTTRLYYADQLTLRRDLKAAQAQYEAVQQQAPNNLVVLNNLAVVYGELKDSRAIPTAEQALKLKPNDPTVQDTLGWILLAQGQTARALDLLKKADERGGAATPDIRYHYAAALAQSGDKAKAKQLLDAALQTKGAFPGRAAAQSLRDSLR